MKKRFFAIVPATVLATSLMLFIGCQSTNDSASSAPAPAATTENGDGGSGGLATLRAAPVSAMEKVPTGDGFKTALETAPLERNFDDQPPLVSHAVDKYPVTRNVNKCMDCHSEKTYKKEKATRVSASHYIGLDGKKLSEVSSRRHFCLQCHVPQVDAKPLISNTFQRAK